MKRVLTAVVLIPLVLLVLFKAPLWLFTLVVGIVALGAVHEYTEIIKHYKLTPPQLIAPLIAALLFCGLAGAQTSDSEFATIWLGAALVLVVLSPIIFLMAVMRTPDFSTALTSAGAAALSVPYIVLTLFCLPLIRSGTSGIFLILFMFIVVWSGDVFAYYAGRAFGKHKLAPRISPGKTWEGTIASFVGSVFLAHILFVDNHQIMNALFKWHLVTSPNGLPEMIRNDRLMQGLALGGCVNIAAQVGDLVESMMKRGAGIKDSGTLLPGHGGILDRIDALLFAAPVVGIYALVSQAVGFS